MVSATLMIHMNEITNAAVEREAMIVYESNLDMSTTGNAFFFVDVQRVDSARDWRGAQI